MIGAAAIISCVTTICLSRVSEASDTPECTMPDGSQLSYSITRVLGNLAYACEPKPVQIGSFDGLSGHSLKSAVKEAIAKFESEEQQLKHKQSLRFQFGTRRAKCVLPDGSKVGYGQFKAAETVLYRCELEAVAVGCADRSRNKPRLPGETWKVFSEAGNNELGYIESCLAGGEGEDTRMFQIKTDGCFYRDKSVNVGCILKFHADHANIFCVNTATGQYELVDKLPKKKLGRKYVEILCTESGPERMDCLDGKRSPRKEGQTWLEPVSPDSKIEFGLVKSCQRSGDVFSVVTESCYHDGRVLAIGCYYKLKDWNYVSCEKQGKSAKVQKFHTLLHTLLVKDCGSFEESAGNLPQDL